MRKKSYNSRKGYRRYVPKPVKRFVYKALAKHTEDKFTSSNLAYLSSIGNAWIEAVQGNPSQGTDKNTRIGNMIKIKSYYLNGVIAAGANGNLADDAYNVVRVVLGVYGGIATGTPLQTAGLTLDSVIRTDWQNARGTLIQKIFDKYIPLTVTSTEKGGGDGYAPGLKRVKLYHKFKKPLTIQWNDNSNSYPNKKLILSVISDSSAVTNPGFVAGYQVCNFEDA